MIEDMGKLDKFSEDFLSRLSWNKKSLRTTFKLSQEATEMLASLTEAEGSTVKDFFDNFCLALLFAETPPPWELKEQENDPLLTTLKDENRKAEFSKIDRQVRKTYVISQTALTMLARSAKQYNMSRDAFVEYIVRFSRELLDKQREETRKKHVEAFEIIKSRSAELENSLEELKRLLDEGDPIRERFGTVCIVLDNLYSAIEKELKDGTPINPNDL
jgi:hypothetical protein